MLVQVVRLAYLLPAGLSMTAAALVTASMVIAERAPQTAWFWGITISVSLLFAVLALLLLGIARHLPAIGRIAHSITDESASSALRRPCAGPAPALDQVSSDHGNRRLAGLKESNHGTTTQ